MYPSEFMDQLVHDLIAHYEAEMLPTGLLYLELRMKGHGVLIIEEQIKHKQMRLCYWLYAADDNPVPEPEVWFHIDASGHWIPYEIRRHTAGHHLYATWDVAHCQLLDIDVKQQAALAMFADFWAEILRAQGWVGGATKCITQPQAWLEPESQPPRPPDIETLWDWADEYGLCQATDGCWCAVDGRCEHGYPSWLLALDLL